MKKRISVFLCLLLLCCAPSPARSSGAAALSDIEGFRAALSDWILGTSWGVLRGGLEPAGATLTLVLSREGLDALTDQDRADIRAAMTDMLRLFLPSREMAEAYAIAYLADGDAPAEGAFIQPAAIENAEPPSEETQDGDTARANLIFIHHSVGENWLQGGLNAALIASGYHVADITYGWREYGDHTDTADWPTWFTDAVMAQVYGEMGAMSAYNGLEPRPGENTVILFKSCFPNSDVGGSVHDEQAVYESLLPYMESRPDKAFILVTPPPMQWISTPGLTRQLCLWLADRSGGWLADYAAGNVFVFDLYNILTHEDAHHRMEDGREVHTRVTGADTLRYDSRGDDHPNADGNRKAAEEFAPLLEYWMELYISGRGKGEQGFGTAR